jgi:uncharacterized protein
LTFKNTATYNDLTLQKALNEVQINVAQLLRSPVGSSSSYQVDETIGKEGISLVEGEVTLSRTGLGIMVKATMTAHITDTCSRCLNPAEYTVKFDVAEEFLPETIASAGESQTGNFDSSTIINENNVLDLSEVIRQYALLAMPSKPLCSPECAGLCPACGHDLNKEPCKCSSQISGKPMVETSTPRKGE